MIFEEKNKDINILKIQGSFDNSSIGETDRIFHQILTNKSKKVILDMSGLDFINSKGIDKLIMLYRLVQNYGGRILVTSPKPVIREVFEITKLNMIFELFPDKETALMEFS